MKPLPQLIERKNRRDARGVIRKGNQLPKTDYSFQASALGNFSSGRGGELAPSFRRISENYFTNEAPGHFASEAALFLLLVMTSAVPVIQGIRGLIQFVYGVL